VTEPTDKSEKEFVIYIDDVLNETALDKYKLSKTFRDGGKIIKHDYSLIVSTLQKDVKVKWKLSTEQVEEPEVVIAPIRVTPAKATGSPPQFAEHCIAFLAPKNTAQAILGDMEEMFQNNVRRLGEKEARRIYWMQVRASGGQFLWQWFKRIGFFTVLVDYVRGKIGF
jgi:hypothetical protein